MVVTLKFGSTGSAVLQLQKALNTHGASLIADAWFGKSTEAAVAAFQRSVGLVVDGVAGPKTISALLGDDYSRLLREADLQAAADRLGVELACVKAVNAVESRGSGFLPDDRPIILLERHVAYRQAKSVKMPVDTMALRYPNLINQKRGGYSGGAAEWSRFDNLRSVTTQSIAVESCSWGLFQIMGHHWNDLGYASADDFQQCMASREGAQLEAFIRFIEANPTLLKALKSKKWADFARMYNGPAYKENLYDAKLAAEYTKAERLGMA